VQVEHHRLLFIAVDALDAEPRQPVRGEPEISAPANRQVPPEQARCADRELDQAGRAITPDLVGKPRCGMNGAR
jgi:hypothetical protein